MKTILLLAAFGVSAFAQDALYDRFFDDYYFHYSPTQGTSAGFHQYDDQMEDYSQKTIAAQTRDLHRFEKVFERLHPSSDRDMVLGKIRGDLLEIENIRPWEKNPDVYSSAGPTAIFPLISRTFAPPEERLKSVIAREKRIPDVLEEGRENLKNPPNVFTRVALEQIPGNIDFFERDVPEAFKGVKDPALMAEFKQTNAAAIKALKDYATYLTADLLPASNGDFRIGADNYRRKLAYDEMVDTPLDELLKVGYANLRDNQRQLKETAAKLDPKRTPEQILEELQKDHPTPDKLLDAFRGTLGGLREFITSHHIATIPSQVLPILEETPPFLRALTTASMDTPGPYEKVATEAFFNVTLPDPSWPKERIEQHMQDFHWGTIVSTAIHEAYPGHYLQFLWIPQAPSKTRKLLGSGTNAEGWAHYCEQMMLDEGYGNGDLKLRLGQLQDALLRNARYIVGIEMHTGKMTFDQGVEFFVKEGHQTRELALVETKRGASDPTYLMYTLGKLEILKLRADYKKMKGAEYSLQQFHDALLKQGFPPIKIVRRELLGSDSPAL